MKTKERGITLIALLITIIVLVVLAAVVIMNLTGGDNLVDRSIGAVESYDISQYEETIRLAESEAKLDKLEDKEIILLDRVQEILEANPEFKNATYTRMDYNDIDALFIFIKGHAYLVNQKEIEYLGSSNDIKKYILPSATIEIDTKQAYSTQPIEAKVTQEDQGTGVNIAECKWIFVKQEEPKEIGIDESLYTGGTFTSEEETIYPFGEEEGIYYLHVLTVNNARNKKETIAREGVTILDLPEIAVNGKEFSYLGSVEPYEIPMTGVYQLEVWGASAYRSNGGYSIGYKNLKKGDILYIACGGTGTTNRSPCPGGFNGGGTVSGYTSGGGTSIISSGGGATHIALNSDRGILSNYVDNKDEILIVAGGGGGGHCGSWDTNPIGRWLWRRTRRWNQWWL